MIILKPVSNWAQTQDSLRSHFIIAVDVAYGNTAPLHFIQSPVVRDYLFNLLEVNGYDGKDYLTFVSYALNLSNPNFDTFVSLATDLNDKPILWRKYENALLAKNKFGANWGNITVSHHQKFIQGAPIASMQSLAKEYILKTTSLQNQDVICDETILLMITDEIVNGVDNNYVNEYNNISTLGCSSSYKFRKLKQQVFDYVEKCNSSYRFQRAKLKCINGLTYSDGDSYFTFNNVGPQITNLKIVPYRVLPTKSPAIQTITNIPSLIPFRIVKGGYKLKLDVKMLDKMFEFGSLDLVLPNSRHKIANHEELFISHEELSDGDSIALELEVLYKDGIYNGITMSPSNPTYKNWMTLNTEFRLQQDAKIMGIIPLKDGLWWFFPDNVRMAIVTWDIIIILVFIMIICYVAFGIFRRITRFTPSNKDISLNKN